MVLGLTLYLFGVDEPALYLLITFSLTILVVIICLRRELKNIHFIPLSHIVVFLICNFFFLPEWSGQRVSYGYFGGGIDFYIENAFEKLSFAFCYWFIPALFATIIYSRIIRKR